MGRVSLRPFGRHVLPLVRLLEQPDLSPALKHPFPLPSGLHIPSGQPSLTSLGSRLCPQHDPLALSRMTIRYVGGFLKGRAVSVLGQPPHRGHSVCWLYDSGCKSRREFVGDGVSGGTCEDGEGAAGVHPSSETETRWNQRKCWDASLLAGRGSPAPSHQLGPDLSSACVGGLSEPQGGLPPRSRLGAGPGNSAHAQAPRLLLGSVCTGSSGFNTVKS